MSKNMIKVERVKRMEAFQQEQYRRTIEYKLQKLAKFEASKREVRTLKLDTL